jgi:hypothetical protein
MIPATCGLKSAFEGSSPLIRQLGMHLTQVPPTDCDSLLGGLGDAGVGRWAGVHGLLYEAEKQLPSTSGFSPIKAKRKLIEVVRQMLV